MQREAQAHRDGEPWTRSRSYQTQNKFRNIKEYCGATGSEMRSVGERRRLNRRDG